MKRERTCLGCGAKSDKVAMYRIVRNPNGNIEFDPTGRAAGRGAYICSEECLKKVVKSKKLASSLRCPVSKDMSGMIYQSIEEVICRKSSEE